MPMRECVVKRTAYALVLSALMIGAVVGVGVVTFPGAGGADEPPTVTGYINEIPKESPEARAERHRVVAERRTGTPIILHRGAWRFAPENTLEAYAAAMDHGADGVEFDVRRSKDGVLYLMHDDTFDRTTECSGKGRDKTYYEIASCKVKGAGDHTHVPTLAALLVLARQRAMLLHLDVKESGLQDDLIKVFDEADIWDHFVEINGGNADRIRGSSKAHLLVYKGGLDYREKDPNSDSVRNFLALPGDMIFMDKDPAIAVQALGRAVPDKPVPLPKEIYQEWSPP
jgi:hypothetical protein